MTHNDFRTWLQYHQAKYPGLVRWMADFPAVATDASPSRDDVANSWYRSLRGTELDDARRATDLLGTDEHPEPRGWERHPLEIAKIAKRVGRVAASSDQVGPKLRPPGTETYRCRLCRDYGVVKIYHPMAIDAIRVGNLDGRRRVTAAARCSCNDSHHLDLAQYDPRKHYLARTCPFAADALAELRERLAARPRAVPTEWEP